MLVNKLVPYVKIIDLPLDFSKESQMPKKLEDFEDIITSEDFKFGFKIYGGKIVPFSEKIKELNNQVDEFLIISDTSKVFEILNKKSYQVAFYVVNISGKYAFHIDKNISNSNAKNDNGILEVQKVQETILSRILSILSFNNMRKEKSEKIVDPYITQNIISYLNSLTEFNSKIAAILSIEETDFKFIVTLQKRNVEKNEAGDNAIFHYSEERVEILKDDLFRY